MRSLVCILLLSCPLLGQDLAQEAPDAKGNFFVDGIVYQFATAGNFTVVAAARPAINRKFLAVKLRVYNQSQRSITVQPDDIAVEDAIRGRDLIAISGTELARRMRKPYNMARYAVNGIAGPNMDAPSTSDMVTPQFLAMMQAMAARANSGAMTNGKNVLYTDTPGALADDDGNAGPVECDQVCRLRNREAQGADPLAKLQRQTSPEDVEDFAFRANTLPPRANVAGVLYYPLGKLAEAATAEHGKKRGLVRVSVPVMGEKFQFELPVE